MNKIGYFKFVLTKSKVLDLDVVYKRVYDKCHPNSTNLYILVNYSGNILHLIFIITK